MGLKLCPSFNFWSAVRLSPFGNSATIWPTLQAPDDDDDDDNERAAMGEMLGRGYRSTGRKLASVPLRAPQIPYNPTCARTRAAAVGSQQLTP
jgi:hypothetical protein